MYRWLFVLALLLTACGGATTPAAQTKTVDGVTIALDAKNEATMNKPQTWLITLTDAAGAPIDNADVYLDLAMPSMTMGQNKPLATPQGNGVYQAEGVYSMGGVWRVTVHAEVAGVDHAAEFDITVGE